MFTSIFQLDRFLVERMSDIHTHSLDVIMILFTKLGDFGFLWILLTLVLIFQSRYRHIGYVLMIGLCIDVLLGEGILKHIFYRERPFQELSDIVLLIPEPLTSSFPSGHSSASWCFALIFTYFFWKKSQFSVIYIWIFAVGVTLSRLYLQVHYPSDLVGGIFVGAFSALIALYLYSRGLQKTKQ